MITRWWEGTGEFGCNKKMNSVVVKVDPGFYRPQEVYYLEGNP